MRGQGRRKRAGQQGGSEAMDGGRATERPRWACLCTRTGVVSAAACRCCRHLLSVPLLARQGRGLTQHTGRTLAPSLRSRTACVQGGGSERSEGVQCSSSATMFKAACSQATSTLAPGMHGAVVAGMQLDVVAVAYSICRMRGRAWPLSPLPAFAPARFRRCHHRRVPQRPPFSLVPVRTASAYCRANTVTLPPLGTLARSGWGTHRVITAPKPETTAIICLPSCIQVTGGASTPEPVW